jgi:hypothetical protein
MGQKMLNALAFIQRMPDLDDKVIEKFAHKDHPAKLLFK